MSAAAKIAAATLILLVIGPACGGATSTAAHTDPREGPIVDLRTARRVSFRQMLEDLARARVVYVGESHDEQAHHDAELALLSALRERGPALALGLEMVQTPFQAGLDAWVAGELDEAALRAAIEWDERWGFDFALYEPLFAFCRAHRIRMIALNAPAEITRVIGRQGLDGLDPAARASLPELDLTDAAHRAMIRDALAGHPGLDDASRFERLYTAQVVWDETMASSVAAALTGEDAPTRLMVIAGAFHVQGGLGIPNRAARRGATPMRVVVLGDPSDDDASASPRRSDYQWSP